MNTSAAQLPAPDPIMERLEDQIAWYDRKSVSNQRAYRRIKITEILAAAVIPFLVAPGLAHLHRDCWPRCVNHGARRTAAFKPVPAKLDQLPLNLRSVEA